MPSAGHPGARPLRRGPGRGRGAGRRRGQGPRGAPDASIDGVAPARPGPAWPQQGRRVLPGLGGAPGQGQTRLTNGYRRGWGPGVGPWGKSPATIAGGPELRAGSEPGLPLPGPTVAAEGGAVRSPAAGPVPFLLPRQAGAVTMTRQYDRGDVPRSGDAATRAGSPTPGGPQGGPQSTGRGQKRHWQSLQWRWLSTPAERDAGRSSLPGAREQSGGGVGRKGGQRPPASTPGHDPHGPLPDRSWTLRRVTRGPGRVLRALGRL